MATTNAPGAVANVPATHVSALGRSSQSLKTALVVYEIRNRRGVCSIRDVADFYGIHKNAAENRLGNSVTAGWLKHQPGVYGAAYMPTTDLLDYVARALGEDD